MSDYIEPSITVKPSPRSVTFLTIGYSPRPDLSGPIEKALPPRTSVRHLGVLDGLEEKEAREQFGARPASTAKLVSCLRDGAPIALDAEAISAGVQRCIDEIDKDGADVALVLCTGSFSAAHTSRTMVLQPDRVVTACVAALVEGARLGVLVPSQDQFPEAAAKWRTLDATALFGGASPFDSDPAVLVNVARDLIARGAGVLVLDCMAYTTSHRATLRSAGVDVPILVSTEVFARTVSSLFD